ncbi:hypothetical protein [Micromonospora sp. NPDC049679]|uniref:hypothetical protein n=1 Tax=Micromonospora sp. NPDC049679 TaxID=3155920 RepID=UPI0033D2078F
MRFAAGCRLAVTCGLRDAFTWALRDAFTWALRDAFTWALRDAFTWALRDAFTCGLRDFAGAGAVRVERAGLARCGAFSERPEAPLGEADRLGRQGADGTAGGRESDGDEHGGGMVGRQRPEPRPHPWSDSSDDAPEGRGPGRPDSCGRSADRAPAPSVHCCAVPTDVASPGRCADKGGRGADAVRQRLEARAAIGSPPRPPNGGGSTDGGSGTTTGPSDGCGMNGVAPPGRAVSLMVDDPALIAASTGREVMTTSTETMNA